MAKFNINLVTMIGMVIVFSFLLVTLELKYLDIRREIKSSFNIFSDEKSLELSIQPKEKLFYNSEDLQSFDLNVTGFPFNIVPNYVHYVLFEIHEIQFGHFVSMLSVLRNQKPDKIYIHCDCYEMKGEFYKRVVRAANKTKTQIIVRYVEKPTEIFGHKLNKEWINWHASDITRIRMLQEFGGIYLDRDVYVVKSLDVFRKFEMTVNWDEGMYLGNQVQIGHRKARFLQQYYELYKQYDNNQWYYNAGDLPTKEILWKHPEYIHRCKGEFGTDAPSVCPKIFREYYENWRKDFYAVHMVMRGDEISFKDWCFGDNKPAVMKFNEENSKGLNVTFGQMAREVFDYEAMLNKYDYQYYITYK